MNDRQLRDLLHDAVADVEPRHDALDPGPSRRAHWLPVTVAAALVTVLALTGTAWLVDRGGSAEPAVTGPTVPSEVSVVAYAVAETGNGARLVADRRTVPASTSDLRAALLETLGGPPAGQGYSPVWAGTPDLDVAITVEGALVSVDLQTGGADDVLGDAGAPLLGQAVAWTVSTALGDEYVVVEVTVDGQRPSVGLPGATGLAGPLRASRSVDVLAPVTIESVADGAEVSSPVTVSGQAATFEGTVAWRLLDGEEVVDEGFTTARECCTPTPYSFELDAPPGDYVLEVAETDPAGAEEGDVVTPYSDTRRLTVTD